MQRTPKSHLDLVITPTFFVVGKWPKLYIFVVGNKATTT
jgi:hypothetical protein